MLDGLWVMCRTDTWVEQQKEKVQVAIAPRRSITFTWGGKFQRVPADFELPLCDVFTAWSLWWEGNAGKSLSPFHMLAAGDFSSFAERRKMQKQFSNWKKVMSFICKVDPEGAAAIKTKSQKGGTPETDFVLHTAVVDYFDRVTPQLWYVGGTGGVYSQRIGQMKLKTFFNHLSKNKQKVAEVLAGSFVEGGGVEEGGIMVVAAEEEEEEEVVGNNDDGEMEEEHMM